MIPIEQRSETAVHVSIWYMQLSLNRHILISPRHTLTVETMLTGDQVASLRQGCMVPGTSEAQRRCTVAPSDAVEADSGAIARHLFLIVLEVIPMCTTIPSVFYVCHSIQILGRPKCENMVGCIRPYSRHWQQHPIMMLHPILDAIHDAWHLSVRLQWRCM